MNAPIHVISLGVGVQSTTMAGMADNGELTPRPALCEFADTKHERRKTYELLEHLKQIVSIPINTVSHGDLALDSCAIKRSKKTGKLWMKGLVPAFTLSKNGSIGLLGRKCTLDKKIEPIRRHLRDFVVTRPVYLAWRKRFKLQLKIYESAKENKLPIPHEIWDELQTNALVVMWLGISTDEAHRAKPSQVPWIRNWFPLLDRDMSRSDCVGWLLQHGFPEIDWSACKFCPFLSDERWENMRIHEPMEFEEAAQFEDALQLAQRNQEALDGVPYLHESCKPLRSIVFTTNNKTHTQLDKFGNECTGLCGV